MKHSIPDGKAFFVYITLDVRIPSIVYSIQENTVAAGRTFPRQPTSDL